MNSFPGRPSSRSKPNTSPPSSATRSLPNSPKRSLVNSQRGSREPASSIVSADLRSRSMTNSPSSCASRPPPTTSPLSRLPQEPAPAEAGVEHRQGPATRGLAPVRKTIYSLNDLREILFGCNRRYLEYLSSLDDFAAGIRALDRLTQPRSVKGCNVNGRNFFSRDERTLLAALQRPGFNIAGLRRPPAAGRPMLSRNPHPTTRSSAPSRRHQTRHRHLSLLSHPRWPRRHRRRPPPHRTHHNSCSRLINLLTRCKHSVRKGLNNASELGALSRKCCLVIIAHWQSLRPHRWWCSGRGIAAAPARNCRACLRHGLTPMASSSGSATGNISPQLILVRKDSLSTKGQNQGTIRAQKQAFVAHRRS